MGGKNARKIFLETHVYREQKTMEKNRLEKVRKYVFYNHTNIVTKKWEKKRENFFPETHEYRVKTMEKNRHEKVRKHVFYKQMNIITKKSEEKNATKNFFQKHTNRVSQKCWKKIISKSAKTRFL